MGDLRRSCRLYGHDGRLWLRRLGQRMVLPAVCLVRRVLSRLLPLLSDLWLLRLVQPVDWRIWARRRVVRTLRRRTGARTLQPAHGHGLAQCRGMGTVWCAWRR